MLCQLYALAEPCLAAIAHSLEALSHHIMCLDTLLGNLRGEQESCLVSQRFFTPLSSCMRFLSGDILDFSSRKASRKLLLHK